MAVQLPDIKSVIHVSPAVSGFVLREPERRPIMEKKSNLPTTFEELRQNIDKVVASYAGSKSNFYKKAELVQICANLQIPCSGEKRDLVVRLRSYITS